MELNTWINAIQAAGTWAIVVLLAYGMGLFSRSKDNMSGDE